MNDFPTAPLRLRVFIAPGADPAGDVADWTWVEITEDVRTASGVSITEGKLDEAFYVDSAEVGLTLNNGPSKVPATLGIIGVYSPRNPNSPYYGQLNRNTPLWIGVDRGADSFNRTATSPGWGTAELGGVWTTLAPSAHATTGTTATSTIPTANAATRMSLAGASATDVDCYYTCSVPVVATGGPLISAGVARYLDSTHSLLFRVEFNLLGAIDVKIFEFYPSANAELAYVSNIGITYTANERIRVRYQAIGPDLRIKVWKEVDPEPAAWTATALQPHTPVGGEVGMYFWRTSGNTNPGSVAFTLDDFEVQAVVIVVNVVEWPVRWDLSGNDSWAPITGAGVLRRLQQGVGPVQSPIYGQLSGLTNTAAWWPLEDGSDSTAAASGLVGGVSAYFSDVTFGADDTLPGAKPVLKFNSSASDMKTTRFTPGKYATGFSVMMLFKLDTVPVADTILLQWGATGRAAVWRLTYGAGAGGSFFIDAWDSSGVSVISSSGYSDVIDVSQWCAIQIEAAVSGANVTWEMSWHQVGTGLFFGGTSSYVSSVVPSPNLVNIPPSAGLSGAAFAHIYVGENTLPFVAANFALVSGGYAGETAAQRVARLCAEKNVPVFIEPGDSEPLGAQPRANFLDLLRYSEEADQGILYELVGQTLGYRPRGARYNQPVTLALDRATGDVAGPYEPVDDDKDIRNDWTVTRLTGSGTGSSARATDAAHIAKHGAYVDSQTINVETDDALASHAGWRLRRGTLDELRWPSIPINLAARPDLIPQWLSRRYGPRITVDGAMPQLAGSTIDVVMEGAEQVLDPYMWDVRAVCAPASIWQVGLTDDTELRADTAGCVVGVAATNSATTLVVVSDPVDADGLAAPAWYAGDYPYRLNVAGEHVDVSAVGIYADDTFNRVTANGWGTSSSGHTWTASGTASDYSTTGTLARHNLSTVTTVRETVLGVTVHPREVYVGYHQVPVTVTGAGGSVTAAVIACRESSATLIRLRTFHGTSGNITCSLSQFVAGVETAVDSTFPVAAAVGSILSLRMQVFDDLVRARLWVRGTAEPSHWHTTIIPTQAPGAGAIAFQASRNASSTNAAPYYVEFDELVLPMAQTLTVTRSINSIVKAQAVGNDVRLAAPTYAAL
jgi:hypothetical protein